MHTAAMTAAATISDDEDYLSFPAAHLFLHGLLFYRDKISIYYTSETGSVSI